MGLRVSPRVERWGLDLAHHGETIAEWDKELATGEVAKAKKAAAVKKKPAKPKAKKPKAS
jgi:hypothetical protein